MQEQKKNGFIKVLVILIAIIAVAATALSSVALIKMSGTNAQLEDANKTIINMSAQINDLKTEIETLKESELDLNFNRTPFIGMLFDPASEDFNVVLKVIPYSPAAIAGFDVGDRIIMINEEPVESFDDMHAKLSAIKVYDAGCALIERTTASGKKINLMLDLTATYAGYYYPAQSPYK